MENINCEISILNLNCQKLSAKFDKLKLFLAQVDTQSQITCITIQETWFDEHTDQDLYCIPGYTLIYDPCRITSHGGVAIYLHSNYSYEKQPIGNTSRVYENLVIEIWRKSSVSTKYLISSIYRPPTDF